MKADHLLFYERKAAEPRTRPWVIRDNFGRERGQVDVVDGVVAMAAFVARWDPTVLSTKLLQAGWTSELACGEHVHYVWETWNKPDAGVLTVPERDDSGRDTFPVVEDALACVAKAKERHPHMDFWAVRLLAGVYPLKYPRRLVLDTADGVRRDIDGAGFAVTVRNDPPDASETWGPYVTEDEARQVVGAFVGVPESAEVVPTTAWMRFDGSPR